MSDYGVTVTGFRRKRLADILDDMVAELTLLEDPVTGETLTVDLADENDPLVLVVNAVADQLAVAWEQLELCHNQFDPLKAIGSGLSGLVQLNGLTRNAGTPSQVQLTLTGKPGTVAVAGKQVSNMSDSVIFALPAFTIGLDGTAVVVGVATQKGPLTALAGTIVKIVTPQAGWTGVTNLADAIPGITEQNDTELRALQQVSTENTGRGMIEDLFSTINNVSGVTYCRAYQNPALRTDERGIPAKTVSAIVQGGDAQAIAQAMFEHLPIGVDTFGSVETVIEDMQGFTYPVRFSRPTEVPVFISVTIDPFALDWPTNAGDLIKEALLNYAAESYKPGTSVYASQLYCPVNTIPGAQITALTIGTGADPASSVVTIDWDEIATFSSTNIVVTEV